MEVEKFLSELSWSFPPEKDTIDDKVKEIEIYRTELLKGDKKYDYEALLSYIRHTYSYRKLPPLAKIFEWREQFEILPEKLDVYVGRLMRVITHSGMHYDFTLTNFGNMTKKVLIAHLTERLGKIKHILLFPKDAEIVGNKVYYPDETIKTIDEILALKRQRTV